MSDPKALAIARAYHRAWSTRRLDEIGQHLAEDLRVEVPINSYRGKVDFVEAVRRTAQMTSTVKMLAEFGNGIERVRQIHDTAALRAAGYGP